MSHCLQFSFLALVQSSYLPEHYQSQTCRLEPFPGFLHIKAFKVLHTSFSPIVNLPYPSFILLQFFTVLTSFQNNSISIHSLIHLPSKLFIYFLFALTYLNFVTGLYCYRPSPTPEIIATSKVNFLEGVPITVSLHQSLNTSKDTVYSKSQGLEGRRHAPRIQGRWRSGR